MAVDVYKRSIVVNGVTITLTKGSVLEQKVDVIVNAANEELRGGGGIDGAIHQAAGHGLLHELIEKYPNGIKTGDVAITGAHNLPLRYIFHTAGPVWRGGRHGEPELLRQCYQWSVDSAIARRVRSLGFCSISTGIYGYPIEEARHVALKAVVDYLVEMRNRGDFCDLKEIVFAMYTDNEYGAFAQVFGEYEKYDDKKLPLLTKIKRFFLLGMVARGHEELVDGK